MDERNKCDGCTHEKILLKVSVWRTVFDKCGVFIYSEGLHFGDVEKQAPQEYFKNTKDCYHPLSAVQGSLGLN